jgi:hypothetical protein
LKTLSEANGACKGLRVPVLVLVLEAAILTSCFGYYSIIIGTN